MAAMGFSGERQKCGTAEDERPERSETETLPDVATTVLLASSLIVSEMGSCIEVFGNS